MGSGRSSPPVERDEGRKRDSRRRRQYVRPLHVDCRPTGIWQLHPLRRTSFGKEVGPIAVTRPKEPNGDDRLRNGDGTTDERPLLTLGPFKGPNG